MSLSLKKMYDLALKHHKTARTKTGIRRALKEYLDLGGSYKMKHAFGVLLAGYVAGNLEYEIAMETSCLRKNVHKDK